MPRLVSDFYASEEEESMLVESIDSAKPGPKDFQPEKKFAKLAVREDHLPRSSPSPWDIYPSEAQLSPSLYPTFQDFGRGYPNKMPFEKDQELSTRPYHGRSYNDYAERNSKSRPWDSGTGDAWTYSGRDGYPNRSNALNVPEVKDNKDREAQKVRDRPRDRKAHRICLRFLQGCCPRKQCKFAHVSNASINEVEHAMRGFCPPTKYKTELCAFYPRGECTRGAMCTFVH